MPESLSNGCKVSGPVAGARLARNRQVYNPYNPMLTQNHVLWPQGESRDGSFLKVGHGLPNLPKESGN